MSGEGGAHDDHETADVVVVGGGIAGLSCARQLAARDCKVIVLEAANRFGGRIETGGLGPPPFPGNAPHRAEFGPMRFELDIQPLFAQLLRDFNITATPFSAPSSPEPPVEYPLAEDERLGDTPLPALELLKLGIFRLLGQETFIAKGKDGKPAVELSGQGRSWLGGLSDEKGFDELRREAPMPGTERLLWEFGLWNALYTQLSPMAVAKILHFGTFYHLMPDNPNAAEWAVFWLRLFQLGGDRLSTIDAGVQVVSDALVDELERSHHVQLMADKQVLSVHPGPQGDRLQVESSDGRLITADHVVLALPKQPLEELDIALPKHIREDLDSVIAFPLLKVLCVTKTPPWWRPDPPPAQNGAWNAPTRELHYLPARDPDDKDWQSPDYTMVLLYTDRPATAYWQPYLVEPDRHHSAEINRNEELKSALASVLFNIHWEWAKDIAGMGDRTGRDALSTPKGQQIISALRELFDTAMKDIEQDEDLRRRLGEKHPALVGDPARILFHPKEVQEQQVEDIGDYAIRDWSRPPFGAGCHAWAPGARSWEVRERLAGFGLAEDEERISVHVCGEAYSDYQGFIEGALRSANDAVKSIVAARGGSET